MPGFFSTLWWIAIVVAAFVVFIVGAVWYAPPVFGRHWMTLNGYSDADMRSRGLGAVFAGTFVLALVMTINLAMFLGPNASLGFSVAAAAAAGVGWTAAGFGITYLFERRPLALWLINAGYHVVTLTGIGAVLGLFAALGPPKPTSVAEVRTTSYVMPAGDRVLSTEVEVDATPSTVWRALTTSEGLRGFAAPVAAIDLRPGGMWEASHDRAAQLGDPGNILNEVITYVPERMLSIRIARTPPNFPHPEVARQVWTVIEIVDLGHGRSRVVTSMCGWKQGPAWDDIYNFFDQDNRIVASRLKE